MAKYVVLFKLTSDSVAGMIQKPSDRRAVVAKAAETAGGKLLDYYWMFGQYDGLCIFDAPDSQTMAALMLAVAGRGALSHVETHELIDAEDIEDLLKRSKGITYSPPGK
jgi:uncharacterized protein with GYD domain